MLKCRYWNQLHSAISFLLFFFELSSAFSFLYVVCYLLWRHCIIQPVWNLFIYLSMVISLNWQAHNYIMWRLWGFPNKQITQEINVSRTWSKSWFSPIDKVNTLKVYPDCVKLHRSLSSHTQTHTLTHSQVHMCVCTMFVSKETLELYQTKHVQLILLKITPLREGEIKVPGRKRKREQKKCMLVLQCYKI